LNPGYFPYPLQLGVLDEFCRLDHLLARPVYHEGQVLVSNGYILLRIDRGLWMASDFQDAPADFVRRFLAKPWKPLDKVHGEWRAMDEIKPLLYRCLPEDSRPATHMVWRLGSVFLARTLHLQLIGRLPRVDLILPQDKLEPLRFRFSGGSGMLLADPRLEQFQVQIEVMQRRYAQDGHEIKPPTGPVPNFGKPPAEEPPLEGWPPVEVD
jgi:hypothetical protein